jgi:hypothetical protein
MAGLVPAIHAAPLQITFDVGDGFSAWMPGTRPGMTCWGCKGGEGMRPLIWFAQLRDTYMQ